MGLRIADRWLWDFWFAQEDGRVHVFYLQAPRSLGDPEARHLNATIGHAVSTDLRHWDLLEDALHPGELGAYDDQATWTGSIVRHDDVWWMFYTGVTRPSGARVQRVLSATSPDLVSWSRTSTVVEADETWYENLSNAPEANWRDPWVFRDEESRSFHMLVTARANHGPADGRGVIGHAASDDLLTWRVGPPLSAPGEFAALEVPQLIGLDGRWLVLFSAAAHWHSAARLSRPDVRPETGTHYLQADSALGPYTLGSDQFLVGYPHEARFYAGRLLRFAGELHFFAWEPLTDDGDFAGVLSDPMPVTVHDGHLQVRTPG